MRLLFIGILLTALSGCGGLGFPGVYRIDIEQGNIVTQEMVDQLKPGMTRRQVRYVLGTPLLENSFNQSRWDYIYTLRNGYTTKQQSRLTVFFEGEQLTRLTGDMIPEVDIEEPESLTQDAQLDDDQPMDSEPEHPEPTEG
jgi:outer membrane protein assembly factor BamE